MIIVSHRGNTNGETPTLENHPDVVQEVLNLGIDVEVDLWVMNNKLYLGHDLPMHEIDDRFLKTKGLWIHCKNMDAVLYTLNRRELNTFYHQNDDISITSHKYLWTFPNKEITPLSIAVLPELYPNWNISKAAGVCTDYPIKYKWNILIKTL